VVDPQATIAKMVEVTDGELVTLTGGEWREEERNWLVPVCWQILKALSWVMPLSKKSGQHYGHFLLRKLQGLVLYPLIHARAMRGKMPDLPHAEWAREDEKYIEAARQQTGCAAPSMRGLPTAKAFKFFAGVPGFGWLFEQKVIQAIRQIVADNPNTVISLELPAETAFIAIAELAGDRAAQATAQRMAASLERIIRGCPKGTKFAFHICWGDLRRRPFVQKWLQSNEIKVFLINAITQMSVWKEGWILFAIHDPLCDGKNDPDNEGEAFEAYNLLKPFPKGVIYILGLLRDGFGTDRTIRAAKMLQSKLEHAGVEQFALAPPCGDARKPHQEVEAQYVIGCEAIELLNAA
jgi:hypothetical protein